MADKLLAATDVAELLGIELDTLYRYARRGEIRAVKIGKMWRFTEADVQEFIQARRVHPTPPAAPLLLTDLLRKAALSHPLGGVYSGGARTSFADIDRLSDALARDLRAHGLQPGDRVLVLTPNCPEFIITCFAVWKARAVLVADYIGIRQTNLEHILRDASPAMIVIDQSIADMFDQISGELAGVRAVYVKDGAFLGGLTGLQVVSLDAALAQPAHAEISLPAGATPDELVSISYTSGSTGLPKGVMHTHDSWLAGAEFTRDYPGLSAQDKIVISLPLHHGLAFRQVLGYLLCGGSILLASDVYQALRLLKDHRPTAMVLVPAAAALMIDHFAPVLQEADAHLRYVEIGSAALPPERLNRLRELLPTTPVHLPYGLTEARVGFLREGEGGLLNRISTISPGLELRLLDADSQPVARGEIGQISLRGRGLMKGYWGRSALECEQMARDGFHTGDMGRLNERGEVELLGRLDDMLKIGGRKVNPAEVEMALSRHPGVAECAVAGLPDPRGVFELELHAFVVPKANVRLTESELLAHCRRFVESYKAPAHVHLRTSLPKSPVGKILRHALAATTTV